MRRRTLHRTAAAGGALRGASDDTVRLVSGSDTAPFLLRGATPVAGGQTRLATRQEPPLGIVLSVEGQPLLRLRVDYRCAWDHAQRFLTVDKSAVGVFASEVAEPLFRYE